MDFLRRTYSLDLRSLSLFRMGLAVALLGDLIARAQGNDLRAFYTDFGVLPRDVLVNHFAWPQLWSLHLSSGSAVGQAFLFCLAGVFAVALFSGFHTRIATMACWILVVSLQSRNPFILHAGDTLLRVLFFWAIFLPLGKRWSADSWKSLDGLGEEGNSAPLAPSLALTAQIAIVYLFSFLLKSGPEWRDGSAVLYALNIGQMSTPFGQFLIQFPHLLQVLTYSAVGLELLIPILVFLPWQSARARVIAISLILLLQVGFGLSLRVGHFPYFSVVAALALLPAQVWEGICSHSTNKDSGPMRQAHIVSVGILLLLGVVIWWNIGTLWERYAMPTRLQSLAVTLRLEQEWNMFAPRPLEPDGWYVIPGTLRNGNHVDVWRSQSFSDTQWQLPSPSEMNAQYPSERWAVFLMDLHKPEMQPNRLFFARYLCRRWNENSPEGGPTQLETFEIYFVERENQLDRSPNQRVQKNMLHLHHCFQ